MLFAKSMLNEWMNSELLTEEWLSTAGEQYRTATPFPHIQIQDFLKEEQLEAIEEALSNHQFEHKESDLFSLAQTPALNTLADPVLDSYLAFLNSTEFREWMHALTGVMTTPGLLDAFGAIYMDTDYLLPHDDQLDDRKIAYILYLTSLTQEQGGALALYTDENGHPAEVVKRYPPQRNALNVFTVTDTSWHEVEEVTADTHRVSIGGWLRG